MGTGFQQVSGETAPSTPSVATDALLYFDSTTKRPGYVDGAGNVVESMQRIVSNLALNGGLGLWQRQVPGTYTTYSATSGRTYFADRFGVTNENASVQAKRVDTVAGAETGLASRYYASMKKITNAGKVVISHVLPADVSFPLRARYVRVSGVMRTITGSGAGTMRLGLLGLSSSGTADTIPGTFVSAFGSISTDPTWGTNLAAIAPTTVDNCIISGNGATCTLSGAWQRFSASFLVPAGTQNLVAVLFSDGQLAINDEFGFSQFMVTEGQAVRDFVPSEPAQELESCQRYFYKTFLQDTGPAANTGIATGPWQFVNTSAAATTNRSNGFRYPADMRATPSAITFYNPATAASAVVRDVSAAVDAGAPTVNDSSARGFWINWTGNASTALGGVSCIHFTAEAEL